VIFRDRVWAVDRLFEFGRLLKEPVGGAFRESGTFSVGRKWNGVRNLSRGIHGEWSVAQTYLTYLEDR
jgi:hypothetical protein